MRFLAEAPWYPTVLLPGQGVRWISLGPREARAELTDGDLGVCLDFTFDAAGKIASVFAPDRPRMIAGKTVPTPWRGTFTDYEQRNGMLIPTRAEVAWLLPAGAKPYWRGHLVDAYHEWFETSANSGQQTG